MCWAACMFHPTLFALKRAYLSMNQLFIRALRRYCLTPARVQLLQVLDSCPRRRATQRQLADLLGVTGATVSRMLKELEYWEVVTRTRGTDGRTKIVAFTQMGWDSYFEVIHDLALTGVVAIIVACAAAGPRGDARRAVPALHALLHNARDAARDMAAWEHPPDERAPHANAPPEAQSWLTSDSEVVPAPLR